MSDQPKIVTTDELNFTITKLQCLELIKFMDENNATVFYCPMDEIAFVLNEICAYNKSISRNLSNEIN